MTATTESGLVVRAARAILATMAALRIWTTLAGPGIKRRLLWLPHKSSILWR